MNEVEKRSAQVEKIGEHWGLITSLLGGTSAMRAQGETYLPKWPNEELDAYSTRVKVATLFPIFKRTVQTLAAKPFSRAVTLNDDIPATLRTYAENDVDLQGRNLHSFASDIVEEAIAYGLSLILVDYPVAEDVRTRADEINAGLRPYWVQLHPWQLLGWKTARINGSWQFTQLRFTETVVEEDGEFGEKHIKQIRVLTPGAWQIWRENEKKEWALFSEGTTSLKTIPIVPIYGERHGFMDSSPPLLEVAHLNVEHWQSSSDQQTILNVARVPILAVIGADENFSMTVGSSTAVKIPLGGDMKFVEHTGAAIKAGSDSLKDLEERARQAGAELLVLQPGKITATQVNTENAVGMCALQEITLRAQDALNTALQFTADWIGEAKGGTVALFNDFGAATLADASAQLLLSMNQAGKLSDETLFSEMKRRAHIAENVTWTEEKERI
ncbi:MAG: DUF4055 domain-containing protein, partial [Casimicrobium sp.]